MSTIIQTFRTSIRRWLSRGRKLDQHLYNRSANNLNLLRLIAAVLVMVSHCFIGHDPVGWLTGNTIGGSILAMPIFFFLSGLLVSQSLAQSPTPRSFLTRRFLRLYPAGIAYVVIIAVLIGPIVSSLPARAYFADPLFRQYLRTASLIQVREYLPGVFTQSPIGAYVNTSLWSIPMEIKLYAGLLLTGFIPGRFRTWVYVTGAVLLCLTGIFFYDPVEGWFQQHFWSGFILYPYTQLTVYFLTGALCYQYRHKIVVRHSWLLFLLVGYLAIVWLHAFYIIGFLVVPGAVLYFATHGMRWLRRLTPRPDLSYGIYLWGVPVEQLVLQYLHPSNQSSLFLLTLAATTGIALLSWYGIEKPALNLLRHPTAQKSHL